MKRREFITLLGGAAAAWPLAARAQQASGCGASACSCPQPRTIRNGRPASRRSCRGWGNWAGPSAATCGSTIRWGATNADRIRRYAAELVALAPDVILARRHSTVGPLLQATRTVPIVFTNVTDPVGAGFVESLARPGGNATGFHDFRIRHRRKWLELLKEIAPGVTRVAVLRDATQGPDRPVWRHPGRGAVARGGGDPGRRARRRRDRARRRGFARTPNGGLIVTASGSRSFIAI